MIRFSPILLVCVCLVACVAEPPADSRTNTLPDSQKADNWFSWDNEEPDTLLEDRVAVEAILHAADCESPCTFETTVFGADGQVDYVEYSADGWYLGRSWAAPYTISYSFTHAGPRVIEASVFSKEGSPYLILRCCSDRLSAVDIACDQYESTLKDSAPIQVTGDVFPPSTESENWFIPSTYTAVAPFSGVPGELAIHEGVDYIQDEETTPFVPVIAASRGTVAYVRTGCDQSDMFLPNIVARECGSGWGNHVVIHHGENVYTRYAHLAPGSVTLRVGDEVNGSDFVGEMGNTGRSETRHLHFELGISTDGFDPCSGSQSFELVFDPSLLGVD